MINFLREEKRFHMYEMDSLFKRTGVCVTKMTQHSRNLGDTALKPFTDLVTELTHLCPTPVFKKT